MNSRRDSTDQRGLLHLAHISTPRGPKYTSARHLYEHDYAPVAIVDVVDDDEPKVVEPTSELQHVEEPEDQSTRQSQTKHYH